MKKIIRLSESDLRRIVRRVISEEEIKPIDFPGSIGEFEKTLPLRDKFKDEYTYTYFLDSLSGKPTRSNPHFSLRYNSVNKKWTVSWSDGKSEEGKKIVVDKSPYLPNGEYDEQKFKKMFDAFKFQQNR